MKPSPAPPAHFLNCRQFFPSSICTALVLLGNQFGSKDNYCFNCLQSKHLKGRLGLSFCGIRYQLCSWVKGPWISLYLQTVQFPQPPLMLPTTDFTNCRQAKHCILLYTMYSMRAVLLQLFSKFVYNFLHATKKLIFIFYQALLIFLVWQFLLEEISQVGFPRYNESSALSTWLRNCNLAESQHSHYVQRFVWSKPNLKRTQHKLR